MSTYDTLLMHLDWHPASLLPVCPMVHVSYGRDPGVHSRVIRAVSTRRTTQSCIDPAPEHTGSWNSTGGKSPDKSPLRVACCEASELRSSVVCALSNAVKNGRVIREATRILSCELCGKSFSFVYSLLYREVLRNPHKTCIS